MLDVACLIIDDAYSVVLDDLSTPLKTIILEYCGPLIPDDRPRILGLTRYPIHVAANFGYAALRMEQFLNARVFGQHNARRAALKRIINKIAVSVLEHPVLHPQPDPPAPLTGQYHIAARITLHEIGNCAYPLLAYFSVDSALESMTPNKMFSALPAPNLSLGTSAKLDKFLQFIQAASQSPNYQCVVIGTNPFIILALGWIISTQQRFGIRSAVYLGQSFQEGATTVQHKTLEMFKSGSINTLVCTDSIFSNMDGGICSHILWFGPPSSLIGFAQSRVLARNTHATVILMTEQGNREHYRAVRDVLHAEPLVLDWIYSMGVSGAPSPPSSLARCPRFDGTPIILTPSRPKVQGNLYIMDPVSGSRIYPKDATEVVYRYLANHPTTSSDLVPARIFTYTVMTQGRELWTCTANLSVCTPPLQISGKACLSKAAARASACFEVCSQLFDQRLLSSHLFPLRPIHTLSHGVLQSNGPMDNYPIASPLFWHNCILAGPSRIFYPMVVGFTAPEGTKVHSSMIILTRLPLDKMDSFSIFSSQNESKVDLQPCAPLALATERIQLVFRYTMYLWRAVTNKTFECPSGELAYYVCPVMPGWDFKNAGLTHTTSVEPIIMWQQIENLVLQRVRPLNLMNAGTMAADLAGGVLQDRPNEFTRRFEGGQLRQDLNPLSRIMSEHEGSPAISLLDYYATHRHEFEGIRNLQQPLIEACLLPGLVNRLEPQEKTPTTNNFLVPEMCHISSVPSDTFHTALIIPSVIWHIENVLVAKELNLTLFQGQVRDDLLVQALCSRMAKRTFDYERLEFLGDTFIKYAASAYLYVTEPDAASGPLHSKRQKMVSNKALWTSAQVIGLPTCIQSEPFRPKYWAIPNATIMPRARVEEAGADGLGYSESVNPRVATRTIPPKVIADAVEAIIGAGLLSGGEKLAFSVAKALGLDVWKTCDWLDVVSRASGKMDRPREPQDKELLKGMMKVIGTTLEDPDLLLQAMHHPSLSIHSESYERLEFLGDSILDMLVVQSFFADPEKWSPHCMTLIKSSMVSNRVLAIICVESGLHRFLLHDKPTLAQNIKNFVEEVERGKREAQTSPERIRYWSKLRAPKELGDVVEALLESAGCNGLSVTKTYVPSRTTAENATKCEVKLHGRLLAASTADKSDKAVGRATQEALSKLDDAIKYCTCKGTVNGKKRKRASAGQPDTAEAGGMLQADELLGRNAENPIDVDMFDF
ncbi:endoribonuclease Dicer [Ceratobasidium sp. AG-Ba]|nr:endoribonuclease Dicer [Ceratobasidium sp. AG-Ba]QRW04883.1 endoribonuclease Dicer [Ceratobasidium sp. AG-Ba]